MIFGFPLQEIKELQALASRDTTAENREYFKNELALAIRDIRTEYDTLAAQNKTEMESWYKLKVSGSGCLVRLSANAMEPVPSFTLIRSTKRDINAIYSHLSFLFPTSRVIYFFASFTSAHSHTHISKTTIPHIT